MPCILLFFNHLCSHEVCYRLLKFSEIIFTFERNFFSFMEIFLINMVCILKVFTLTFIFVIIFHK